MYSDLLAFLAAIYPIMKVMILNELSVRKIIVHQLSKMGIKIAEMRNMPQLYLADDVAKQKKRNFSMKDYKASHKRAH